MGVAIAGSLVSFVELVGWSTVWSEADHWVCLFWVSWWGSLGRPRSLLPVLGWRHLQKLC